jgi:hypothetical protein
MKKKEEERKLYPFGRVAEPGTLPGSAGDEAPGDRVGTLATLNSEGHLRLASSSKCSPLRGGCEATSCDSDKVNVMTNNYH